MNCEFVKVKLRFSQMGHWLSNLFTTPRLDFEKKMNCEFIFVKVKLKFSHMGHWLSNLFTTLRLDFEKKVNCEFVKVKLKYSQGGDMQSYD